MKIKDNLLLNKGIRVSEVLLISDEGEKKVISKDDALAIAEEQGLDLFLVSPNSSPPVAKILDYGHYRYEKEKKQKDGKKAINVIKELKLTPRIGEHDFQVRFRRAQEFLGKGYKVKLTVFFKGREATHPDIGEGLVKRFIQDLDGLGEKENPDEILRLIGRTMSTMIIPSKKGIKGKEKVKEDAKVEN